MGGLLPKLRMSYHAHVKFPYLYFLFPNIAPQSREPDGELVVRWLLRRGAGLRPRDRRASVPAEAASGLAAAAAARGRRRRRRRRRLARLLSGPLPRRGLLRPRIPPVLQAPRVRQGRQPDFPHRRQVLPRWAEPSSCFGKIPIESDATSGADGVRVWSGLRGLPY